MVKMVGLLFHQSIAAGEFADLAGNHKDLIVAALADVGKHALGALSGQHDKYHIHFLVRAMTGQHGVSEVIFL